MKAKYLLTLLLAAGLFFGCDSKSDDSASKAKSSETPPPPPPPEVSPGSEADNSPEESSGSVYTFHDVTYDISLHVIKKTGAIDFTIDVSNLDNNCKHTIKGNASEKEGDLESREVDGDAVFVQEYVYSGDGCDLTISIDLDSEQTAWINEGDCKDIDPMCKLEPSGYLSLSN